MRKQWWTGSLAVVMSAALIAGCSGGNGTAGSGEDNGGQVTLRFSWWGGDGRHQQTLEAIEAYKQVAPNVRIEPEYQGFDGYEQKVKTQLASSTSADIMQLDVPWMEDLTQSDFFLDLSDQSELSLDEFDADFLTNFSTYNDKLVALPSGVNAYALVINKTAADALGVPTDIEWDWETIYEEGKKLHERDSSKHLLLADHGVLMQDFNKFLMQRTGEQWVQEDYTLGFTQEDAVAALTWLDEAMRAGVYQPLGEADLFYGKTEQNPKWINQEIAMISAMSSTLLPLRSVFPEDVEVITALPVIAKDAKDTAVQVRPSQLYAISAKSQHPEEAAAFLNWLLHDAEAAAILGDVRSVPASSAAQQAAVDAGKIDPAIARAVEMGLANATGLLDNALSTNSEVTSILQDSIEKVAFGRATPEQGATELIAALERKLSDLQARQ
ncbi:ABC transporter substrate-binding protein [Paenibacillus daejeonensis]|uniref:ABC transporter substrate-binding protein n=1 Tax=Paenibacillus daejeonensis TaxID=135193 RepID=UPI00037D582F|nr:extracellular solute-binding protein [Paenibacillus daejeonensis]